MAYQADIRVAVKGANQLNVFQQKLNAASKSINKVNQLLIGRKGKGGMFADYINGVKLAVRSTDNLNRNLSKAGKNFNKVALDTKQAFFAAKNYVRAQDEVNKGLAQRNKLLNEAKRSVAFERFAKGDVSGRTQYSSPIGPRRAAGSGSGVRKGSGGMMSGFSGTKVGQAVLGGGFPLLFGGGPGTVAGGAIGGLMGGFAGGIGGSLIGGVADRAVAATAKLGQAFNKYSLDITEITRSLGVAGTATAQYLKTLEAVEGPMAAANEAQKRLKSIIGEKGVANLKEFGERSQSILNSTTKFFTTMTAGLAGILNFADKILGVSEGLKKGEIRQFAFNDNDPILKGLRSELAAIKSPKSTGILGPIGLKAIEDDKKRADILSKMLTRAEQVLTGTTAEDIKNNATMSLNKDIENLEKALSLGTREAKIQKEIATILKEKNLERGKGQDDLIKEIEIGVKRKTQLEEQLVLWNQIKNTIATGLTSAIEGLIAGTKTLGESLASIAKSIASMFLQSAISSLVGNISFGKPSIGTQVGNMIGKNAEGTYMANGIRPFAYGGIATKPTLGLVGEAGEDEYIIPASKMASSMQRYSSGARGEAVIPGTGSSYAGGGAGGSTTVSYSGPILNFNSEEFVPKSAVGQIIATAAKRGASMGETSTMKAMQNNRSVRSRMGM